MTNFFKFTNSIKKIFNDPYYPILIDEEGGRVSRLKNIVWKGQSPTILEDTWKDMAGYAMIGMMLQRGTFTTPLEGQVKEEQR